MRKSLEEQLLPQIDSSKQYSIDYFSSEINSLYHNSEELKDQSLAPAVLEGIVGVGLGILSGKMIGDFIGERGKALPITFGLLGLWLAHKKIKQASVAKSSANKIFLLLEKLNIPKDLTEENLFLSKLFFEYHLFFEILATTRGGIDRLINYFILSIMEAANKSTESQLKKIPQSEVEKQVMRILHDGSLLKGNKITLQLEVREKTLNKNEWKLDELILCSPVFLMKPIFSQSGKRTIGYQFSIRLNRQDTKYRQLRTVMAEATHKYPARFISYEWVSLLKGFTGNEKTMVNVNNYSLSDISELKVGRDDFGIYLSQMYAIFIAARRDKETSLLVTNKDLLKSAAHQFIVISDLLLSLKFYIHARPFYFWAALQNMRNLYWEELGSRKDEFEEDLWLKIQEKFRNLEGCTLESVLKSDEKQPSPNSFSKSKQFSNNENLKDLKADIKKIEDRENRIENKTEADNQIMSVTIENPKVSAVSMFQLHQNNIQAVSTQADDRVKVLEGRNRRIVEIENKVSASVKKGRYSHLRQLLIQQRSSVSLTVCHTQESQTFQF